MNVENSLSSSFFSWGIVFFSSLAIAIPNDCGRLELSEDVLQRLQLHRLQKVRENRQLTSISSTLNHAVAAVNTHTPLYFEVYRRTCSVVGENNGRR